MFYADLAIEYFKNYMKTRLTYRSDFWIEVLSDLLMNFLNLFFILVVFGQTQAIGGWNREQILFIYGFFMVPYGIFGTFFNLWYFAPRYIVKGEMDRILTRPAHSLWQIMLENIDPSSLFSSIAGFAIMAYAGVRLDITLHGYDPLLFLLFVAGAVLVYIGVYTAFTAVGLFTDSPTGIIPLLVNIETYGRYPVTIYNKWLRSLLTWVLPFAFVGFYPAAYFLDPGKWLIYALLTPVVGAVCFAIGLAVWNAGIRRYRGAGS